MFDYAISTLNSKESCIIQQKIHAYELIGDLPPSILGSSTKPAWAMEIHTYI